MTEQLTFIEEMVMFGGFAAGVVAYAALIILLVVVVAFVFGEH